MEKLSLNVSSAALVRRIIQLLECPKLVPNRREVRSTVLFTTTLGTRGVSSTCSGLYFFVMFLIMWSRHINGT